MTNQCDSCNAPATLAICNRCAEELKAQPSYAPTRPRPRPKGQRPHHRWATRRLRGRGVAANATVDRWGSPQEGDEQPAPFAPPDEERLDKDGQVIPSRQEKAARLLISARNMLSTTIRDL